MAARGPYGGGNGNPFAIPTGGGPNPFGRGPSSPQPNSSGRVLYHAAPSQDPLSPRIDAAHPNPPSPYFMHSHEPQGVPHANSNNPYTVVAPHSPMMNGSHSSFRSSGSTTAHAGGDYDGRRRSLHARTNSQRGLSINTSKDIGVKEKYGGGAIGWGDGIGPRGEMLSPKTPDPMHDMGKMLPRQGRSRYIIEGDAFAPFTLWSARGWLNIGGMLLLAGGLVTLFAGWPIATYFGSHSIADLVHPSHEPQRADPGLRNMPPISTARNGLVDPDTPQAAMTRTGFDGEEYELVFSDEFNVDGRTFWKGDDPFWEAVDFNYWPTGDREWYDPEAAVTKNGSLVLTIEAVNPEENHNLPWRSAMLQTWNKFCFTGGYVEARAMLPGSNEVSGFWPAVWTMGNLGRAGYGATTDGMWPYSYNECDIGTLANQSNPTTGQPGPDVLKMGDKYNNHDLSYLSGMKLSRCTCAGEDHPGPTNPDGSFMARSAPEIDVFEIYADEKTSTGMASQSLQMAPFDAHYKWANTTGNFQIFTDSGFKTALNGYTGGVTQEAISGLSRVPVAGFELTSADYNTYGFEYRPSYINNDGFVTWSQEQLPTWSINQTGLGPNSITQIGQRLIPGEPMYLIANLGLSEGFVHIDFANLQFPAHLRIDYIRVYQRKDSVNVGCDPAQFPTADYINSHADAYNNPNATKWSQTGRTFPKNSLIDNCQQP